MDAGTRPSQTAQTLVITATYNESGNIARLIDELFHLRDNVHVLVVDDNSPDGTGGIVKKLMNTYQGLHLLARAGKLGYGTAYIEGFNWGLARKQYNNFVSMDADFSHLPSYIPHMLEQIKTADVVIGSRYVDGGGTKNWGMHRKILSRGANVYSRFILHIPVHDCTSGFRCYRREMLEKIDFSQISSNGYSFLEELLYFCKLKSASFYEIPIIFNDREFGKSKINKTEIIKAILKVPSLRFCHPKKNKMS